MDRTKLKWAALVAGVIALAVILQDRPSAVSAEEDAVAAANATTDAAATAADAAADAYKAATEATAARSAYYAPSPTYEDVHGASECTSDCSGHDAGYAWAEENGIEDASDCGGNSQSFIEGCEAYVEDNAPAEDEAEY